MTTKDLLASYLSSLAVRVELEAISPQTQKTYTQGVKTYANIVGVNAPISTPTFVIFLKRARGAKSSVLTAKAAVMDFYKYAHSEHGIPVDLIELQDASRRYLPKLGKRLIEFDQGSVDRLISYAANLSGSLVNLRNRALIITVADSGLRASEVCGLVVGDLEHGRVKMIGKGEGGKEAVVRFSSRSIQYIQEYLDARAELDARYPDRADLPLFARHDKKSGNQVLPFRTGGFWSAVKAVGEAAGVDSEKVWPHVLRHRFVTEVWKRTGDLKKAQVAARHQNIQITQKYTHLSDEEQDEVHSQVFG